ncbi:polygalacturonase inhibitor-like [Vicia villosa]|uniref:polygalacturonase inhibitor-like n=1 Tax=Vicia villosa TaxID=3911 RepID=UPI00273CBA47|nr:polygalacturonase inhibitor-like [Vicia villosa]
MVLNCGCGRGCGCGCNVAIAALAAAAMRIAAVAVFDANFSVVRRVITNHTAIAARCGCGDYRISNIAAAIAVADRNLKPINTTTLVSNQNIKTMMFGESLVLCFLSLLLFSPFATSEECNPQDKKALLQIKKHFNTSKTLQNIWNPKTDCCIWDWIDCDPSTNRVTGLVMTFDFNVPSTDIVGHIPSSVAQLPYLDHLEFNGLPKLTGTINPVISHLKHLKHLVISSTGISGTIPSFLSQFQNLEVLDLSRNSFTGTIPSWLSQLPKITTLRLNDNKLTGQIPNSFSSRLSFSSFKKPGPDIYLSNNRLSGHIPASLGQLDPESIDLSGNKLEGDASFLFGSKKRTQAIDLSRNLLSFDLSKVGVPKSLTFLHLDHNYIYGKVPQALTKVDDLGRFNVSYNLLCGEIPQGGRADLQRFGVLAFYHNKCLCGSPLPKCK